MRFLRVLIAIVIFFVDILLFYSFPLKVLRAAVLPPDLAIMGLGFIIYCLVHFVKRPEEFYIWNHEFSHLIMSKLFFKKVKGFHITRRKGGRVELDGSNFIIDLSPYFFFPIMFIMLLLAILFKRAGFMRVDPVYFIFAGLVTGMMFVFTVESIITGQEDIKRNGILFSLSLILLINTILLPLYFLPGIIGKKAFLYNLLRVWGAGFTSAFLSAKKMIMILISPLVS